MYSLLFVFSLLQVATSNELPPFGQSRYANEERWVTKFTADLENETTLNVHIVPHTHDDVGWLKTVEEYYFGLNNTIQNCSVQDILDTVMPALQEHSSRTFTYVEMKFFSTWWFRQSETMQAIVRSLIQQGQLNFVNGGWCMHDEATTHFMGMIDQTTLGHDFLQKELGVIPKVGWQLDPFGHSATQASLLTSGVGFDALYFGRIDYQDLELRRRFQQCEGFWNSTNADVGRDTSVFWGLTGSYGGNYGSPSGYCFDELCGDRDVWNLNVETLSDAFQSFLEQVKIQSDQTQGHHIMLTMGSDFHYKLARKNFVNLDTLIGSIMEYQQISVLDIPTLFGPRFNRIQLFYSSPDYYTECKYKEYISSNRRKEADSQVDQGQFDQRGQSINYKVKTDDFYPYSDCSHCFWTGYFVSRTGFKRYERVASSFLMAARQIDSLASRSATSCPNKEYLLALQDALGVAQHHDALTGTAKQHVANDYAKRLADGVQTALPCLTTKLKQLFLGVNASIEFLQDMTYCPLLNESTCDVSQVRKRYRVRSNYE